MLARTVALLLISLLLPSSSAWAAEGAAGAALDAYDATRAALAADDLAAAKKAADALASTAQKHTAFRHIASAAASLTGAADIAAARLAFGEASKALITAIAADASLGKGLYAFRCPMASGYKKWVERSKDYQNPYMGKRMLKCGGATEMTP